MNGESTGGIECPECGAEIPSVDQLDKIGMDYKCPRCWETLDVDPRRGGR